LLTAVPAADFSAGRREAMRRETRAALRRGEMLAAAADLAADRRAVDLAEAMVESAWQLLCHLNGGVERLAPRRGARRR
jgi:hypothetical protein